ncbi:MAG: hypothetical protein VB858_09830, partial [Planctomycetaceae bacterium]
MTDTSPVKADPAACSSLPAAPSGMAAVARRIFRRTTDFLAIVIIAGGVFAVSGRLSNWWSTPAETVTGPGRIVPEVVGSEVAWPEMDIPVGMHLGNFPVRVERLMIRGDRQTLDDTVLSRLRDTLNSRLSQTLSSSSNSQFGSAAEQLEQLLTGIRATEEKSGIWKIYRLDEPGTPGFSAMFLGTRLHPADSSVPATEQLITWAMAIPWRQTEWKVFFFERNINHTDLIMTPPNSVLTMSLQEPSGTELTAFRATDPATTLATWQTFY